MIKRYSYIFLVLFLSTISSQLYGQNVHKAVENQSKCKISSAETLKKAGKLTPEQEIEYYSPIRYVIVYNDLGPDEDDRRIDLLMDVKNINEQDLRNVFCWISERYPSPTALSITVHTSLTILETPEENELLRDGNDSRFSKYYNRNKSASYHRFDNGREAFGYTVSLSPYRESEVVIRKSS